MIETYKIITNKESVNPNKFFQMKRVRTGDRVKTLKVKSFKRYKRSHYFTHRVINRWNKLSHEEVTAEKTSNFKKMYDKMERERKDARRNDIYEW